MKLTATQLRNIIREEVKKATSKKTTLSEAMTRITEDEVAAWKNGDWGYVSGDHDGLSDDGLSGHDHEEFLHGSEEGHPHDDEGYMAKSSMASMKHMAEDICGVLDSEDQLPAWVQDHIAVARENLQQVHGYLIGDVEMKSHEEMPLGDSDIDDLPQVEVPEELPVEEVFASKSKPLNEAHARVTQEEMRAWMRGDWGFTSEDSEED